MPASGSGHKTYCYAELTVSSLAVAKVVTSTHFAYPQRMSSLSWPWSLITYRYGWPVPKMVTHPCTNLAPSKLLLLWTSYTQYTYRQKDRRTDR